MSNAVVVTGTELQELVLKAVDGIYIGRNFENYISKENISLNDGELELMCDDCTVVSIPIFENRIYPLKWISNQYFDYVVEICNTKIAFNIKEKSKELTFDEFLSLINIRDNTKVEYVKYDISTFDCCPLGININNCSLRVESDVFIVTLDSEKSASMTITLDEGSRIENLTEEYGYVCYGLKFEDDTPDLEITLASCYAFNFIGQLRQQ